MMMELDQDGGHIFMRSLCVYLGKVYCYGALISDLITRKTE